MPRRQGFTLLEIIIAIAVILILMGMVVVGMQFLSASSKEKATGVTLGNAQSMLAELESTAGLSRLETGFVAAPGDVSEDGADRASAARLTRRVLRTLRSVPTNRAAMDQLPTSVTGVLRYKTGLQYEAGDEVTAPDGKVYVATGTTTNQPPSGAWAETTTPTPLLLDAWNQPLVYVPAPHLDTTATVSWEDRYGLRGLSVRDRTVAHRMLNPGGLEPDTSATASSIYPPSGDFNRLRYFRPFWVSAGPDGNFTTHDDNIYSFEN